jgi:diadenosine tetraphosphate (Ap4A) HIT family hydrolase
MSKEWMARERWDALVRGEGCPLCAELAADAAWTEEGYVVADLAVSRLRLSTHQSLPGYCVLICKRPVREPYALAHAEQLLFFEDMMRVGRALEQVFASVKLNFDLLGNAVPHLHCHIKPRYYGDPAGGIPIWPDAYPHDLAPEEYEERVAAIRAALAAQETTGRTNAGPLS